MSGGGNIMKIRVLPKDLAERIAAGEVIESPVSVVKELVENSIDAQSKRIDITLVNGGKTRIVVDDDGNGMDPDDMELAILRHATSKIHNMVDLEHICTLGFRGEALASILAVSRIDIRSRASHAESGILMTAEAGNILARSEVNCSHGTRVQVDDLFFNLPGRKKFMKSALGEFRKISRLIRSFALAYPDIDFVLNHDGRTSISTQGKNDRKQILELFWGNESEIVNGEHANGKITVEFWFQKQPGKKKIQIWTFVNGRVVQDPMVRAAVNSSLGEVSANVAVFLSVPSDHVDVNIHPAKTEVRFRYGSDVFEAVHKAARYLVSKDPVTIVPDSPVSYEQDKISFPASNISSYDGGRRPPSPVNLFSRVATPSVEETTGKTEESEATASLNENIRFLGQLKMGYLIFETPDSMQIMDHHAAHERVTFERIKKRSQGQRMVFPLALEIEIPPHLTDDVHSYLSELERAGFAFSQKDDLFFMKAVPLGISDLSGSPFDYLISLIHSWNEGALPVIDASIWLRWATMACKAAVKLTTRLLPQEALRLWADLMRCDNPFACPHGRPTILEMSGNDLVKYFGR
jgi:DNA mismatch repair protein MutL